MVVTFHLSDRLLMDCLLVRVNNRLSRTSGQALFRTLADVLILSNVPVYTGPYRVAYVLCIYACLRIQLYIASI